MSAYNNYGANGLNGYNNPYGAYTYLNRQYQPIVTQPQPQVAQPTQQIATDFPLRFANMEEAKAFIVMPNQRQFFLNNETSELYVKSADSIGQSFFDEYSLVPKKKQDGNATTATVVEPQSVTEMATKDDIKGFVSKDYVSALENQISALNSKVDKVLRLGEIITPKKASKEE